MHSDDKVQSSGRINSDHEMEEFLAELDAIDTVVPDEAKNPTNAFADRPALLSNLAATAEKLKADAYANGWTAQARRKIDAHRKAHPEDHARNRRGEYEKKVLDATGKLPRRNRKNPTPEQRASDLATNSKNYRKRMSQADRDAANWNRAERRRQAKEAKAKAEQDAMEKLPTFGIA